MSSEQDALIRFVRGLTKERKEAPTAMALVEIGCGTGRSLFTIASEADLAARMQYLIGIDRAPMMISEALHNLYYRKAQRLLDQEIQGKFSFFDIDAQNLSEYFADGELLLATFKKRDRTVTINPAGFTRCSKIFCCLLNTLGIMRANVRGTVVKNMIEALGNKDRLIISVLQSKRWTRAPSMYKSLEPLTGPFSTGAFKARHDFETADGYYSHWFEWQELRGLLEENGAQLLNLEEKACEIGDAGYFVACKKQGAE